MEASSTLSNSFEKNYFGIQNIIKNFLSKIKEINSSDRLLYVLRTFIYFFAFLTIMLQTVLLNPLMPAGVDWPWAVCEAYAKGLPIIFTYGPYISLVTKTYYPETYWFMLCISIFLGIGYAAFIYLISKNTKVLWPIFVYAICLTFLGLYYLDSFSYVYSLFLCIVVYRFTLPKSNNYHLPLTIFNIFLFFYSLFMLGLFPFTKGTNIFLVFSALFLCSIMFFYCGKKWLSFFILLLPVFSSILFWLFVEKSLLDLPIYFKNMIPIMDGYSEAMSLTSPDSLQTILIFIIFSGLVIIFSWLGNNSSFVSKCFLYTSFILFLFTAFKGGFVRHAGGYETIPTTALASLSFFSSMLSVKRYRLVICLFGIIPFFLYNNFNLSFKKMLINGMNSYSIVWSNLNSLKGDPNVLYRQYTEAVKNVAINKNLPLLPGTTDIYPDRQDWLIASGNKWSPRPAFQSYAAYTPTLAILNERHLRSKNAPNNILFRVAPIDGRYPSLEDGLSWPTILNNYHSIKYENELLYLKKNKTFTEPLSSEVYNKTHSLGESITLPSLKGPLFAEIDIEPTLLGRAVNVLFKLPYLRIFVTLKNGQSFDYRIISGMTKSGFIISPLVQDTEAFGLLATNPELLSEKIVEKILITSSSGPSILWNKTYTLKLKEVKFPVKNSF